MTKQENLYIEIEKRNPIYLLFAIISGIIGYWFIYLNLFFNHLAWDLDLWNSLPQIYWTGSFIGAMILLGCAFGLIIFYFVDIKTIKLEVKHDKKNNI